MGPLMFVLVHSPIVGPGTWEPVASALRARGHAAVVPDLIDDGSPPFWRQHTRCVVRAIAEDVEPGLPLVLVAHSGGGQLLGVLGPVLRDAGYHVTAEVLVDAGLPPGGTSRSGQLADESPAFADELRAALTDDGRFPTWTDDDLVPLVGSVERRTRLVDELRPQPAAFWDEPIPTSVDWPDAPVGVLILSDGYASTRQAAREQQWPVQVLEGNNHFLTLADEDLVADGLLAVTKDLLADADDAMS